jgi:hypothetical protein
MKYSMDDFLDDVARGISWAPIVFVLVSFIGFIVVGLFDPTRRPAAIIILMVLAGAAAWIWATERLHRKGRL